MYLVLCALLHAAVCVNIQVEGDVAFDVKVYDGKRDQPWFPYSRAGGQQRQLVLKMSPMRRNVTVAPVVECSYQYPEKKQVDAVLSNMMNELTKVFIRANDFLTDKETRRRTKWLRGMKAEGKGRVKKEVIRNGIRQRVESRYRVVKKKQKAFFEVIYTNMTNEYKNFYKVTAERVDRSSRDPCLHQDEIKQMWRDLLDHSQRTLDAAAHRCVDEYLRNQRVEPGSRVRPQLQQFLVMELATVRARQIEMLCDIYQLCYYDLLQ